MLHEGNRRVTPANDREREVRKGCMDGDHDETQGWRRELQLPSI